MNIFKNTVDTPNDYEDVFKFLLTIPQQSYELIKGFEWGMDVTISNFIEVVIDAMDKKYPKKDHATILARHYGYSTDEPWLDLL